MQHKGESKIKITPYNLLAHIVYIIITICIALMDYYLIHL